MPLQSEVLMLHHQGQSFCFKPAAFLRDHQRYVFNFKSEALLLHHEGVSSSKSSLNGILWQLLLDHQRTVVLFYNVSFKSEATAVRSSHTNVFVSWLSSLRLDLQDYQGAEKYFILQHPSLRQLLLDHNICMQNFLPSQSYLWLLQEHTGEVYHSCSCILASGCSHKFIKGKCFIHITVF